MMYKYKAMVVVLTVMIFNGCSNSKMQIAESKQLVISNEKSQISIRSKDIKKRSINLSSLFVEQYTFKSADGSCVVFEDVQTVNDHMFASNDYQTIKRIFDATDVQKDETIGSLTFYQVILRDKKSTRLNVLVMMETMYSVKLLYGFDNSAYNMFKRDLAADAKILQYSVTTGEPEGKCIQNRWPDNIVIIDPLVRIDD